MKDNIKTVKSKKGIFKVNIILLIIVAGITLVPFVLQRQGEFLGQTINHNRNKVRLQSMVRIY
jgi:hypothetical protein